MRTKHIRTPFGAFDVPMRSLDPHAADDHPDIVRDHEEMQLRSWDDGWRAAFQSIEDAKVQKRMRDMSEVIAG